MQVRELPNLIQVESGSSISLKETVRKTMRKKCMFDQVKWKTKCTFLNSPEVSMYKKKKEIKSVSRH